MHACKLVQWSTVGLHAPCWSVWQPVVSFCWFLTVCVNYYFRHIYCVQSCDIKITVVWLGPPFTLWNIMFLYTPGNCISQLQHHKNFTQSTHHFVQKLPVFFLDIQQFLKIYHTFFQLSIFCRQLFHLTHRHTDTQTHRHTDMQTEWAATMRRWADWDWDRARFNITPNTL